MNSFMEAFWYQSMKAKIWYNIAVGKTKVGVFLRTKEKKFFLLPFSMMLFHHSITFDTTATTLCRTFYGNIEMVHCCHKHLTKVSSKVTSSKPLGQCMSMKIFSTACSDKLKHKTLEWHKSALQLHCIKHHMASWMNLNYPLDSCIFGKTVW